MKRLAKASARDAKNSIDALKSLKSSIDMNLIQKLTTTVSSSETEVVDLRDLMREAGEIILKVVTGKISIAGHPSGLVGV